MLRLTSATATATSTAKVVFAPQMYPNPTSNLVRVQLPAHSPAHAQITVYDLQGRRLGISATGHSHTLDTST